MRYTETVRVMMVMVVPLLLLAARWSLAEDTAMPGRTEPPATTKATGSLTSPTSSTATPEGVPSAISTSVIVVATTRNPASPMSGVPMSAAPTNDVNSFSPANLMPSETKTTVTSNSSLPSSFSSSSFIPSLQPSSSPSTHVTSVLNPGVTETISPPSSSPPPPSISPAAASVHRKDTQDPKERVLEASTAGNTNTAASGTRAGSTSWHPKALPQEPSIGGKLRPRDSSQWQGQQTTTTAPPPASAPLSPTTVVWGILGVVAVVGVIVLIVAYLKRPRYCYPSSSRDHDLEAIPKNGCPDSPGRGRGRRGPPPRVALNGSGGQQSGHAYDEEDTTL
ncbi:mucin-2-like [Lethenteron reissneri]|uniref:mucin-2-like n=1 Tax=Lethenteron reissneri TaxID=7753 RepID=UPI002AB66768|nr:mucin-2-like [Lethenteron reissneri]